MSSQRPVVDQRAEGPLAWRCELCRRLCPMTETSYTYLIEDVGREAWLGAARVRARNTRLVVSCRPCRRKVADLPGEDPDAPQA